MLACHTADQDEPCFPQLVIPNVIREVSAILSYCGPRGTYEKGHLYFLKGSWISICRLSLSFLLKAESHTEHLKGFSPAQEKDMSTVKGLQTPWLQDWQIF